MSPSRNVEIDLASAAVGRIDRLELLTISQPLVRPFATALGALVERRSLIVRVESESNVGWGECAAFASPWYSPETIGTAHHVIREFLAPSFADPAQTVAELLSGWSRVRGHSMAKAAVENALLDLVASRLGVPLWRAIGGERRPIRAGLAVGLCASSESLLERVAMACERGYRFIKLKVLPGRDLAEVRAIRSRLPDLELAIDANGSYTRADIDTLRALDGLGVTLIEQPFAATDFSSHAWLVKELATPICLDESIASIEDAERAIDLGACDVLCVKQGRLGGLLAVRAVAALCTRTGTPMRCGGMLESGIGRIADLHLQALPGFSSTGDTSATTDTFATDFVEPPVELDGQGAIPLPTGAGLGVRVDERRLSGLVCAREVVIDG